MYSRVSLEIRRKVSGLCRNDVSNLEKFLSNISNCQVVTPHSLHSKGIVLLMGWAGSRVKSVVRYADIYSKLGVPSVCASLTIAELWSASYANAKTKKILRGVNECMEEGCGVILHLFSGAASTFLHTVVEEAANKESKFRLSGIVFDSGPGIFNSRSGLAGARLMKQQGVYGPLTYYAACSAGIMVNAVVGRKVRKRMRTALDHRVVQVPQLYLYSSIDNVTLMDDVEEEIRTQVSRGVDVSSHRWSDSEHVKHFVQYPDEYALQINKFLHKLHFVMQ